MAVALTTDQAPVKPPDTPAQLTPCQAMQAEVSKYTGWDANIVQAIAQAENRSCDPLNHNLDPRLENHGVCVGSYGVLQVGCLHYRPDEDRNDLATNIAVAYRVWQGSGYTAWTQYNNGTYREFLK